jgi:hypothetical protein
MKTLIEWLPDAEARIFIAAVLKVLKHSKNAALQIDEVLEALHMTGYAVVPRGLLDAIYEYSKRML